MQAVASSARLREIREVAYRAVRIFRAEEAGRGQRSMTDRRHQLGRLADQLGDLELELSYSVEAPADIGQLVPSLRVESFHTTLFASMDLTGRAETAARMLQRLERAINAELTALAGAEREADEARRIRWTVAAGFVSTVAIPLTLIFAFFGVNATEVDANASMFSLRYVELYLVVVSIVVTGGLLVAVLGLRQRRRQHRRGETSATWATGPEPPA